MSRAFPACYLSRFSLLKRVHLLWNVELIFKSAFSCCLSIACPPANYPTHLPPTTCSPLPLCSLPVRFPLSLPVTVVSYFSITLILVTKDDCASDVYLARLLEYIFQSIVLVYGLDDITNIKNVERLKKEIKVGSLEY